MAEHVAWSYDADDGDAWSDDLIEYAFIANAD